MATPPPVVVEKKRSWGCCGCGCFTLIVLALIVAGTIALLAYMADAEMKKWTSTSAATFGSFDGGDQVAQTAQKKLDDFLVAAHQHQAATLELTADEINTLIEHNPGYANSGNRILVSLPGNEMKIEFSGSLSALKNANLNNRFVNGFATVTPSFDLAGKKLVLTFHQMQFGEEKIPANYFPMLQTFTNGLINEKINESTQGTELMSTIQTIEVKDNKVVISSE